MPIIELPADDAPLSQGDILHGVNLYGTARTWVDGGGDASLRGPKMCIVLSRSCSVAHKPRVVVSAVEKYPDSMPSDVESFGDMRNYLTDMRDGLGIPDVFYLGQLPDRSGRFCCRFDGLHTIELPADDDARQEFTATRRIASLSVEFLRHLHLRLFQAFANMGFDDFAWLSDADLDLLVSKGESDILAVEKKLKDAKTSQLSKKATGIDIPAGQLRELAKLETQIKQVEGEVAPYQKELKRRKD